MTLVVPYDGSELSKTALIRAAQFSTVFDQNIIVVTVIPKNNTAYARERDWLGPNEVFDTETIVTTLRESIAEIAPDATFNHISVGRDAPSGTIANKIRRFARENEASIVFVGSENAGQIVGSLTVGSSVTTDRAYETMIIPHAKPIKIKELETAVQTPPEIQ